MRISHSTRYEWLILSIKIIHYSLSDGANLIWFCMTLGEVHLVLTKCIYVYSGNRLT